MNMLLPLSHEACPSLQRSHIPNPQGAFSLAVAHTVAAAEGPGLLLETLPPAVVGQGTVGLCHLVHVMLPLDHRTPVMESLQQLV